MWPCPYHEGVWGKYRYILHIFNFGTRSEWSTSRHRPLYPREGTPVPTEQEAGWASGQFWTFQRRYTLFLPGYGLRAVQLVASRSTEKAVPAPLVMLGQSNEEVRVTIRITNRCYFLYYVFISFFLVFSLHVSGFHELIIRGISSCCFYATIWFMQCFGDRLRTSADWFVVVTSVYHHKPVR